MGNHVVPAELQGLSLYRMDQKLCEKWAAVYPEWVKAYRGIDILQEIRKAHVWEVSNPEQRKRLRVPFLNSWLNRAHTSWHQRQQQTGVKHVPKGSPYAAPKCPTCNDAGVIPTGTRPNPYSDKYQVNTYGRCPNCSLRKIAQ
jgi:hypothetical protein